MLKTPVPADQLEQIRDEAWMSVNSKNLVNYKKDMRVDFNTGEIHNDT